MYTIKLNNPSYPKDKELNLQGVGLVANGKSVKMDEEQASIFEASHGVSVEDYFKDSEFVDVEVKKGGEKE